MLNWNCKTQMQEFEEKEDKWKMEIELLEFYGLRVGINCFLFDYEVEYHNIMYSIHTFSAGESDLPILLLLHGFGTANVHFCRVYKQLMQKFRVFSIDLPGMGYSSKENITINTKEEAIDFFVGTLSRYIKELFPQKKVIIGGHSFGGYIATHLLIQYPELFQQLFLLSPAGLTHYDENQIKQLGDTSSFPFWKRIFFNYVQGKWSEQFTLITLKTKWYGNLCINWYVSKRLFLTGKEYNLWAAYMHAMLSKPDGSEKALFILLNYPKIYAQEGYSIEYLLTKNYERIQDVQVFIYFGQNDWMDQQGVHTLQNNNSLQNIRIRKIPNTSHQLNFLNPSGFLEQFFNDSKQNSEETNEIVFN